jgi:hypothetical protein
MRQILHFCKLLLGTCTIISSACASTQFVSCSCQLTSSRPTWRSSMLTFFLLPHLHTLRCQVIYGCQNLATCSM